MHARVNAYRTYPLSRYSATILLNTHTVQESQPPTFLFRMDIPMHIALPGRLIQSHTLRYIFNA